MGGELSTGTCSPGDSSTVMTVTLEGCWRLLLVQAGIRFTEIKKSPLTPLVWLALTPARPPCLPSPPAFVSVPPAAVTLPLSVLFHSLPFSLPSPALFGA